MTEIHYDKVIALDKRVFADIALEKFEMYLVDMNEPDRAYTYATSLIDEEYASDAQLLIDLAEKIATDPDIPDEKRRFDVAVKSAKAAIETIRSENKYKALSALAKVHYASGELQEAVNLQREAWFLAEPRHKSEFKHDLDSYDSALRRAQSTAR